MTAAPSRRQFLIDSGKLALGVTLTTSVLGAAACGSGSSASSQVSAQAWKELVLVSLSEGTPRVAAQRLVGADLLMASNEER